MIRVIYKAITLANTVIFFFSIFIIWATPHSLRFGIRILGSTSNILANMEKQHGQCRSTALVLFMQLGSPGPDCGQEKFMQPRLNHYAQVGVRSDIGVRRRLTRKLRFKSSIMQFSYPFW